MNIITRYMYNYRKYQSARGMGWYRKEKRSSETTATKEATEIKEEAAAAKSPIKEEEAATALEKKGQEEALKTRGCEGISHLQFNF